MKNFKKNQQRGVAILFAVLLVSTVLAISLTLLNITYRQLLLSSTVRESQLAFYAADSALNCARHWDSYRGDTNPFGHFVTDPDTGALSFLGPVGGSNLACGDASYPIIFNSPNSTFFMRVVMSGRSLCAKGLVSKNVATGKTTISVQGYNAPGTSTACPSPATDRTLERAMTYGPY